MSKKTALKPNSTISTFLLVLIFAQCLITLYVVLSQQTQIEHQALIERIQIMKEKGQKFCTSSIQK